jgi:signal transduction histidine kinase
MKFNTALAFFLLGVALWLANARTDGKAGKVLRPISQACAVVIALIGLLTLTEFMFEWKPGIDNLIVQDRHTVHTPRPGRMSPTTAFEFLLLGTALLMIDFETRRGRRPAQWLVLAVFLSGFIALVGYFYDVESLYRVGAFSSVAVHTAALSVLVSVGFLCARPGKGLMLIATDTTVGGRIFRRFLPVAILLMPALGWLWLRGRESGLYGLEFGIAIFVMSNAVILSMLIWWAANFVRSESIDRAVTEKKMERDKERATEETTFLERSVRERTAKLRETVSELERSSHTISHNLRAPVRAVLAFSDFLMVDFGDKLDDTGRDYVSRIKLAAKQMDALIEDVIAYTQVSSARLQLTAVDLDTLVEAVAPGYRTPGADIRIAHPLGTVRGNESFLTLALCNLIDNAVKFVSPGTKPQVEVWSQRENASIRLIVHDHGIGVPTASGDKIFRTFERAHEGYPGTGIGLALVKRAVERMEGSVGFDSKAGEGSSFWVELPKA